MGTRLHARITGQRPFRTPQEATMWGIAAIVAFILALICWLANSHISADPWLTWQTFTITGLLCLAVHSVAPGWPRRAA